MVYDYDPEIKEAIDNYAQRVTKDRFSVNNLEVINFWVYSKGNSGKLSKYSSEFKKLVNYNINGK